MKPDPNNYIEDTQKFVSTYGRKYYGIMSRESLLSFGYEAMILACRSFNGKGDIRGWIAFRIRLALAEAARNSCGFYWVGRKRVFEKFTFISIEEAEDLGLLSVNGSQIKRMMNRYYLEHLFKKAKITPLYRDRLIKRYIEDRKVKDIAKESGCSEAAVSKSIMEALRKIRKQVKSVPVKTDQPQIR